MELHLYNGKCFNVSEDQFESIKRIILDTTKDDDYIIRGKENTVRKGDVRGLKHGSYVYTKTRVR